MALEIRVLGRVDALVDGQPLPLGGSKQRAVLAILALHANRTVSADELIDGLWGDRPPASASKSVQLYISRLRKALGANGAEAAIATRGRGYELQLPEDALDAARFERLVERARLESDEGIVDGAAQAALDLWQGAPLPDVAEEPFAAPEIRRLEELHLRAIELAIDAELAVGRHAEVIPRLEALIADDPLNERFHAQRMLALYRAGRQSEALDAYHVARETLVGEIGIEPGPELRDLQERILNHDPALQAPVPQGELPPQLSSGSPLIAGRDRDLQWVRKRWEETQPGQSRLALLSGPPGVGKTRLAAELAAELVQAQVAIFYTAGSATPDAALAAIRSVEKSKRPALLVLDNADDSPPALLDAAAGLAARPHGSSLLVLVLHRDEQGPPAFAEPLRGGAAPRLALGPLDRRAATEIAELYALPGGAPMPVETLMAKSDGIPLRVHRAASEWAQAEAAERLAGKVGTAAIGRGGLRTAEAELAGSVTELLAARERGRLYAVSEPIDPSRPAACPFRGLAAFDSAHAEYFFGRERLVAGLVARLVGSTMLAVVGPSGSGKSSALRAGLLPALANGVLPGSERWRQVLMRPGEHPLEELGRVLTGLPPVESVPFRGDPLTAALDALAPDERLVLAVDQFEEVFTTCKDEDERTAFIDFLVTAARDPDQRVIVIPVIRVDFLGRCTDYADLSTLITANPVLVGPMTREELRRAIELPARRAGLRLEPRLVSALLADVADEPGGLPLLSTTLLELWEERDGGILRHASYAASGGVSGAVARLAEGAYHRLTGPERERGRAILLRLTDAEEATLVRRRVRLEELEIERDEKAAEALAVLTESRLVTVDEGTAEVAHEALLSEWPRLRGWLEEDAEGRRLHQHLIHAAGEWQGAGRDPAELYRGARLASALDWAGDHEPELNELERGFLDESRDASEREAERRRRTNRRLRALLVGVGILLVAAVIAGVIAISERQGARDAATAEAAQRLGAQALTEGRLDHALRLAGAGVALDDTVATRSNLLSTLLRSPAAVGVLGVGGDTISMALSPDGSTLAVGDEDGAVRLFDTETRELIADHRVARGIVWGLAFDRQGESLALSASAPPETFNGRVQILDAGTGRLRNSIPLGNHPLASGPGLHYVPSVAYTPDGGSLIVGYSGADDDSSMPVFMRRFDAASGAPLGRPARVAPRSGLPPLASPDGRMLVTTDNTTYAVDMETLRSVRDYPVGGVTSAISPDGRTLAIETSDGALRLLDLASGRTRMLARPGALESGQAIGALSPDNRTLATWDQDENVVLWDARRGVEIETLAGHSGTGRSQVFSPDGRTLYTASLDSTVIIWDVAGARRLGRPFRTGLRTIPQESSPSPFALSPDGGSLAVARLDGRVDLIDAETLRRTGSFAAFDRTPATAIEYSPDGRRLAVAGGRGLVGLWDAASGERIGPLLDVPRGACADPGSMFTVPRCQYATILGALEFIPGNQLATASLGGDLRIWDLGRRVPTGPPVRLAPFVTGLAVSPDGSQLAIPFGYVNEGEDGVDVVDVRSGERIARLRAAAEVRSVEFSPDGRLLATGQVDGTAQVWATDAWRQVGPPLDVGRGLVLGVTFSPDGQTLATSSDYGTVTLWDVEAQRASGALPGPVDVWVAARFTPDGERLFAVYEDGRALRWEVDPSAWRARACAIAGGGFTPEQWEEIVPEQDYIDVCPAG
jgi:WD40 repeat protein/DNA-binding SARP family transcriptional activator